jgi:hypothetical protein
VSKLTQTAYARLVAGTERVLLLSRSQCHLCDDAREIVSRVVADVGEGFVERDVDADPADRRQFGDHVPVVFVDGVQIDIWQVSESRLRAALGAG